MSRLVHASCDAPQSLLGRTRAALSSGFFDRNYYEKQRGETFDYSGAAVADFIQNGWRSWYNPSALFDTEYYLTKNPSLVGGDLDPLTHYLQSGRALSLRTRGGKGPVFERRSATKPQIFRDRFEPMARRLNGVDSAKIVDIVIPAYLGYHETLLCIESVLAAPNQTPARIIVIDDASPDNALGVALKVLEKDGLIELRCNKSNQGFVRTANIGLYLASDRDVVLLNSDAEVFNNWLDRLREHVCSNEKVATVTPFSNNATILSYPYTLETNNIALEVPPAVLDQIFAETVPTVSIQVPTGVGFCMYITRACLNELGGLDTDFGRGYGEENDFCQRALDAGWRNIAACDVYVHHFGQVSFGAASDAGKKSGISRMVDRHPNYLHDVNAFIADDPLGMVRSKIDLARINRAMSKTAILHLDHGWGGGLSRHIDELASLLQDEGIASFRAKPNGTGALAVDVIAQLDLPNIPELRLDDAQQLALALGELPLTRIHVHSLMGWENGQIRTMLSAAVLAGLDIHFTIHDYACICPRVHMIDWSGLYCDSPAADYCNKCVAIAGSIAGEVDVQSWRAVYLEVLLAARTVIAPDLDVASRLKRYVPEIAAPLIRSHPWRSPPGTSLPASVKNIHVLDQRRGIAIIGSIGDNKGARVLLAMAADALRRNLPLRFDVIGETSVWADGEWPNVTVTGRYKENEVDALIAERGCDFAFFPAVWPETFCYTLDIAIRAGLACVGFDIGALGRRIKELGVGQLLPLGLAQQPGSLNDFLLSFKAVGHVGQMPTQSDRTWRSASEYYDIGGGTSSRPKILAEDA